MPSDSLRRNLKRFKFKFLLNKLFKGTLTSAILFISIYLIISLLESYFWFDSTVRMVFFGLLMSTLAFSLIKGVILPVYSLININKTISDEQAAKEIGSLFPEVSDKLLNFLQLSYLSTNDASLISAAVAQKTNELKIIDFPRAISFKVNLIWIYGIGGLLIVIGLASFVSPGIFSNSSKRILNFEEEFIKPAPFKFIVTSDLSVYKSDSYTLTVELTGNSIPDNLYLVENNKKFPMTEFGNGYSYLIKSVSHETSFYLEAAGFKSKEYILKVYSRPVIENLNIDIHYPKYTHIENKQLSNSGSLIVPEGSRIYWNIKSQNTDQIKMMTSIDTFDFQEVRDQEFMIDKIITSDLEYEIKMKNEFGFNKSPIQYKVDVIPDQSPQINVSYFTDSLTYRNLYITGSISDDYGFLSLKIAYQQSSDGTLKYINIPIEKYQIKQQFIYDFNLSELHLMPNEYLEVYVVVNDNDAINGSKSAISQKFFIHIPNEKDVEDLLNKQSENAENSMNDAAKSAEELNEDIKELESRLKNKQKLDWQDEKLVEELINEKEKLIDKIEKLKEEHQQLIDSQKAFDKQSQKLQEQADQLQKLMNEVLDEETKKLYDELQNLLKQESNSEEVVKQLNKIENHEQSLERELERAIELFKRMKMETKLEQASEKLKDLAKEQVENSEETKKSHSEKEINDINKKQNEIDKKLEDIHKDLNEVEKLNKDLKSPESLDDLNNNQEELKKELEDIKEELENLSSEESRKSQNDKKKQISDKMKNAADQMNKAAQNIDQMQASAEMEMMEENIDNLRDILDNLIKLSFDQETILEDMKRVQQEDPRFIELSQNQLNLANNAQVIEDSLLSLASRVVQIESFVTKEISEINRHMDETMYELRERNKSNANSHQQFTMTSMNNLALLLSDVLNQMQQAMSEAKGQPKPGSKKGNTTPSALELQKQLSKQIEELKKSGKSGRGLSESLAKLAAEQSELRRQLEQLQQDQNGKPQMKNGEGSENGTGNKLKEAIQMMEENEVDLVNKRLTKELIERQNDILTRMLEVENSMKEQEKSPERKGETAQDFTRKLPPAIEQYLKAKQKEIELLKAIPLNLSPFYKNEVNEYFRRLSDTE